MLPAVQQRYSTALSAIANVREFFSDDEKAVIIAKIQPVDMLRMYWKEQLQETEQELFLKAVRVHAESTGILPKLMRLDEVTDLIGRGEDLSLPGGEKKPKICDGPRVVRTALGGWEITKNTSRIFSAKHQAQGLEIALSPRTLLPLCPADLNLGVSRESKIEHEKTNAFRRVVVRVLELQVQVDKNIEEFNSADL